MADAPSEDYIAGLNYGAEMSTKMSAVQATIDNMTQSSESLGQSIKDTGDNAVNTLAKFASFAAVLVGVKRKIDNARKALTSFMKESSKLAVQLQEQTNRLESVFETDKSAQRFANVMVTQVAASFRLSRLEATTLVAEMGDLGQSMQFTELSALKFSGALIALGGDLTSFQNRSESIQETTQKLARGVFGMTRNLRDLQITARKTDTRFLALEKAFRGGTIQMKNMNVVLERSGEKHKKLFKTLFLAEKLTEQQAEAMALLVMAYEQSKPAINDFSETSASAANQMRIMESAIEDFKLSLGGVIKDVIKLDKVLAAVNAIIIGLTNVWKSMSNGAKASIVIFSLFVATVATLVVAALGAFVAIVGIGVAVAVLGSALLPIVAVLAAIVLYGTLAIIGIAMTLATVLNLLGEGEGTLNRIASGFERVVNWILMGIGFINNFSENIETALSIAIVNVEALGVAFETVFTNIFILIQNLVTLFINMPRAIKAGMLGGSRAMGMELKKGLLPYVDIMDEMAKKMAKIDDLKFNLDVNGAPLTLKRMLDSLGAMKSDVNIKPGSLPDLAAATLEGSVQAATIINSQGQNDVAAQNLAANERTANAAEKKNRNKGGGGAAPGL